MANFLGALRSRYRIALAVGLVLVVGLLLLAFTRNDGAEAQGALQSYQVVETHFTLEQSFAGRIAPGEQVAVLSQVEATVTAVEFSFGDRVEAGQVLYRLDPSDLWRKRAEAQIGYLQATDAAHRIAQWEDGPEMRRSQRTLENTRIRHDEALRRHADGARLFDRGLISRTEMEGLEASLRQAAQAVEVATEDLHQTQMKGRGADLSVARLQQGLAAARLTEVDSVDASVIRATTTGVIVRAGSGAQAQENAPKAGSKVSAGQSLGVIAALDGLDMVFNVDESDLAMLQVGTRARITGPGFAGQVLEGQLLEIAGEAQSGSGDKTQFEVRIRLDPLSENAAKSVRIGMTAHATLILYEADKAISIPVEALLSGRSEVRVKQSDGSTTLRRITLGRVGPNRAEILSGLRVGDVVVWSGSA